MRSHVYKVTSHLPGHPCSGKCHEFGRYRGIFISVFKDEGKWDPEGEEDLIAGKCWSQDLTLALWAPTLFPTKLKSLSFKIGRGKDFIILGIGVIKHQLQDIFRNLNAKPFENIGLAKQLAYPRSPTAHPSKIDYRTCHWKKLGRILIKFRPRKCFWLNKPWFSP